MMAGTVVPASLSVLMLAVYVFVAVLARQLGLVLAASFLGIAIGLVVVRLLVSADERKCARMAVSSEASPPTPRDGGADEARSRGQHDEDADHLKRDRGAPCSETRTRSIRRWRRANAVGDAFLVGSLVLGVLARVAYSLVGEIGSASVVATTVRMCQVAWIVASLVAFVMAVRWLRAAR
jgi:hypothetical protein